MTVKRDRLAELPAYMQRLPEAKAYAAARERFDAVEDNAFKAALTLGPEAANAACREAMLALDAFDRAGAALFGIRPAHLRGQLLSLAIYILGASLLMATMGAAVFLASPTASILLTACGSVAGGVLFSIATPLGFRVSWEIGARRSRKSAAEYAASEFGKAPDVSGDAR